MRVAAAVLCLLCALPAPAVAASEDVEQARAAMERASASLDRARSGKETLAALGRAVAAHEVALGAYRTALRRLAAAGARAEAARAADAERLESMLGAIQTIGRAPRSALLVYPAGPVSAVRGADLLGRTTPLVRARLSTYQERLDALSRIRAEQDAARVAVRGALATLQELRAESMTAIRRHREADLPARAALREQSRAAAEQVKTLEGLARALSTEDDTDESSLVRFSEARGLIPMPVPGRLVGASGDTDPWGRKAPGISLAAPAYAQVSAPWDGTVRYAGPLIDYGEVVVLEPEPGYLMVIAGLARVDRVVGETVLAGERLGDMGGPIPASDDFLLEASSDRDEIGEEKLYIELRKNGAALDPAPWFDLTRKGG